MERTHNRLGHMLTDAGRRALNPKATLFVSRARTILASKRTRWARSRGTIAAVLSHYNVFGVLRASTQP
jgi:hypothetical protein